MSTDLVEGNHARAKQMIRRNNQTKVATAGGLNTFALNKVYTNFKNMPKEDKDTFSKALMGIKMSQNLKKQQEWEAEVDRLRQIHLSNIRAQAKDRFEKQQKKLKLAETLANSYAPYTTVDEAKNAIEGLNGDIPAQRKLLRAELNHHRFVTQVASASLAKTRVPNCLTTRMMDKICPSRLYDCISEVLEAEAEEDDESTDSD